MSILNIDNQFNQSVNDVQNLLVKPSNDDLSHLILLYDLVIV